jgi:hypothetical protein
MLQQNQSESEAPTTLEAEVNGNCSATSTDMEASFPNQSIEDRVLPPPTHYTPLPPEHFLGPPPYDLKKLLPSWPIHFNPLYPHVKALGLLGAFQRAFRVMSAPVLCFSRVCCPDWSPLGFVLFLVYVAQLAVTCLVVAPCIGCESESVKQACRQEFG